MGEWSLQYQRSAVRTQSSAKFYNGHVYCLLLTVETVKNSWFSKLLVDGVGNDLLLSVDRFPASSSSPLASANGKQQIELRSFPAIDFCVPFKLELSVTGDSGGLLCESILFSKPLEEVGCSFRRFLSANRPIGNETITLNFYSSVK